MKILLLTLAVVALAQAGVPKYSRHGKPMLSAMQPPNQRDSGRIIGGNVASHGQFPYMADLWMNTGSFCGGSLISQTAILTAAHCVEGAGSVDAWLGTQNLYEYPAERSVYTSQRIIMHAQFQWPLHDIALLIMPTIALSSFVQPIQLPRYADVGRSFEGEMTILSGWGQYSEGGSISNDLKYLPDRPVISNAQCNGYYGGGVIFDTMVCTANDGQTNGCLGDSGSPLVYSENGQLTEIGVFALISVPCVAGPGAFTRVTDYLDWIASNSGVQIRP